MVRRGVLGFLLLISAGCGGAPAAGGGGSGGGSGPCWPIEAFRIDALEHGTEWEPVFEVTDAGEVYRAGDKQTVRARFASAGGTQTLTLARGGGDGGDESMVLTCGADHVVTMAGKTYRLPYDARDELSEGDKIRVYVADDGEVQQQMGEHTVFGPRGDGQARVVGNIARVRRTAEMVLFLAMGL